MTNPDLWKALLPVVELFETHEVSYYIGGSVASSFTGMARATQDADIAAELRRAHLPALFFTLGSDYYIPEARVVQAVEKRGSFNLIHLETAFKIDVFVTASGPFERACMASRVRIEIPELGRALEFCSPEDIVLHKLQWFEAGNRTSDRQWQDLLGVLRIQGDRLDRDRLKSWAAQLELSELLDRALREGGIESTPY